MRASSQILLGGESDWMKLEGCRLSCLLDILSSLKDRPVIRSVLEDDVSLSSSYYQAHRLSMMSRRKRKEPGKRDQKSVLFSADTKVIDFEGGSPSPSAEKNGDLRFLESGSLDSGNDEKNSELCNSSGDATSPRSARRSTSEESPLSNTPSGYPLTTPVHMYNEGLDQSPLVGRSRPDIHSAATPLSLNAYNITRQQRGFLNIRVRTPQPDAEATGPLEMSRRTRLQNGFPLGVQQPQYVFHGTPGDPHTLGNSHESILYQYPSSYYNTSENGYFVPLPPPPPRPLPEISPVVITGRARGAWQQDRAAGGREKDCPQIIRNVFVGMLAVSLEDEV